ncbi:mononuclear molybdenum enzyme YedY, partial [Rhizobium phaseoli]
MPSYRPPKIASSEITPRRIYMRRREFLGAAALGAVALYGAGKASAAALPAVESKYKLDEKPTPLKDVTTYNNFYEFGLDKGDPAANSGAFKPLPWTVKV